MAISLVSIILPTYNSQNTLPFAVQSLLSQTFKDFEILIMDGLSDDDTVKIAKSYKDDRIRVISEKDSGIYDAMNKGIDEARSEWLYFMGSDDVLLDNRVLSDVFEDPRNLSFDVLYGQVLLEKTNSLHLGEFNAEKLAFRNISHQAIFIKKAIFSKLGKYDLAYEICADHIFNVKWFFNKEIKRRYISRVIARFGQSGVSNQKNDLKKIRDLPMNVKKYGGNLLYFRLYVLRPGLLKISRKLEYAKNRFHALFE